MFFVLFTLQVSPNLKTCYCPQSVPRSTLRPISRQETVEVGPGGDDPCQGMLKILINCPISCLPKKSVKWWVRPASKQAHMQHLTIIALLGAFFEISLTAVLSQAHVDHHHHHHYHHHHHRYHRCHRHFHHHHLNSWKHWSK